MNIARIKETCIYISDVETTRAFYQDRLGLPLISLVEGKHVFFRAGESVLLCFVAGDSLKQSALPPHGARGIIHFAFEVEKEEYFTIMQQIKEKEIIILHEHSWKNGLRSFYFRDPDQNMLEIAQEGIWD